VLSPILFPTHAYAQARSAPRRSQASAATNLFAPVVTGNGPLGFRSPIFCWLLPVAIGTSKRCKPRRQKPNGRFFCAEDKEQAFFSAFHFDDIMRVNHVRNAWEGYNHPDSSLNRSFS